MKGRASHLGNVYYQLPVSTIHIPPYNIYTWFRQGARLDTRQGDPPYRLLALCDVLIWLLGTGSGGNRAIKKAGARGAFIT